MSYEHEHDMRIYEQELLAANNAHLAIINQDGASMATTMCFFTLRYDYVVMYIISF